MLNIHTSHGLTTELKDYGLFRNSKELIINDFYCFDLKTGEHITQEIKGKEVLLIVSKIPMVYYLEKRIFENYPHILLEDKNLITDYNPIDKIPYFFFPNINNACELSCYKQYEKDELITVILKVIENYKNVNDSDYEDCEEDDFEQQYFKKTYIMIDGNGFYKIGKTLYLKARESTLQSQNPTIKLVAYINDDIEKLLHDKYSIRRKRGEWFSFDKSEIEDIIDNYGFTKTTT